ncbi:MAG: TrkH family potassium uptake protein, partial [Halobacteriales archaeon]
MKISVDWRASLALVGTVLKYTIVPLSIPVSTGLFYREDVTPLLAAVAVAAVAGFGLERVGRDREIGGREAFLMVALAWLGVAVVGAVPFVVAGEGALAHPVNALFESMSGITTTGATVVDDFSVHSRSILMWRQVIQWLGGLGILVLATAVLSQLGVGGAHLMETESQTKSVNKLTPEIETTAKLMLRLYSGLTAAVIALLYGLHILGLAPEMSFYDAVAHSFTSISTSGFSPDPRSIEAYGSAVQWAFVPVMYVGATSFVLIYFVLRGDTSRLRRSEEFRFYTGSLLVLSLTVFSLLLLEGDGGFAESLRHSVFNVTSIVTTTGYASADFSLWPSSAKHLLFLCMFLGGMAGSTTCSIKAVRWLVVTKAFRRDLYRNVHPDSVRPVRLGSGVVDEDTVRDIYAFVLVSLVLFFLGAVFVAVDSARAGLAVDEFEAMSAAAATFFNIGPAFGVAGPMESYGSFPVSTRMVMIAMMWVGRIEIIPVLVLLTPTYWT